MRYAVSLVILAVLASCMFADIYTESFTYYATPSDDRNSCRAIAYSYAQKQLLNRIGVIIVGEVETSSTQIDGLMSESFNSHIYTLSAGFIQTEVINEQWDKVCFQITIRAEADPKEVKEQIMALYSQKNILETLRNTQEIIDSIKQETMLQVDRLRQELQSARSEHEKLILRDQYLAQCSDLNSTDYFELGNLMFNRGELDQAFEAYLQGIKLHPQMYLGYYGAGLCLYARKDYQLSLDYYLRAMSLNPDQSILINNIGVNYLAMGDLENAEKYLLLSIAKDENLALPYINLGKLYMDKNQIPVSLVYTSHALALDPASSEALSNIGEIYRRMGDYPKALENVKKALKINPKSSLYQGNLAIIYDNLGDHSRARECYEYALSLNPEDPLQLCNYAASLLADAMIDEAELYYRKCIEADSTYARAYNDLAFIRLNYRQDKELGYQLAAKAAALAPDNLEILDSFGSICAYLELREEAISVYRHLIQLDPSSFAWHHNLAKQYRESNRRPEAIDHLAIALELHPSSEPVLKDLCDLLYEAERYDETLPLLLQLDNLGANDAEHYLRLGYCYFQQDDMPKTRLYWDLSLDQDPANHPLLAALSLVECDLKHYSPALELIDRALALDTDNAEYLRIKSLCLAKLDREQEALTILAGLIQSDPTVPSLIECGRYLVYIEAYDQAIECLKLAASQDHGIVSDLLDDPEFECLREDYRLNEVLGGEF